MESQLRIQNQFEQAKSKYPKLERLSIYKYRLPFQGSDKVFNIEIPVEYPLKAPVVTCNGKEVRTAVTDNWTRSFQFVHIVEQINCLMQVPSPQMLPISDEEIEDAVKDKTEEELQDENVRHKIVENLSTYARSKKTLKDLQDQVKDMEEKFVSYNERLEANMTSVLSLSSEWEKLQEDLNRLRNANDRRTKAVSAKLQEIEKEQVMINSEIRTIENQFEIKEMAMDVYIKQILAMKRKANYNNLLKDFISQQGV